MIRLNLPEYAIKLGGSAEKPSIYDVLRRKYVKLTPEEWVRQHFVHMLIDLKGYPSALMVNELNLKVGEKSLRADTVLYDIHLRPRMILEYKAPHVPVTQAVFDQITIYNLLLHVDYLIVSNGLVHYCCRMDYENHTFHFLKEIPDYKDLQKAYTEND